MCGSESNRPVMIPTVPGKAGMVVEMPIADAVTPVRRVLGFVQNRTLRRACVILIDQGFRSGATFLTGVFVARYCSMAEHGLFFLGFTVILLMANVQETLIASPLYVFLPARRGRFREEYQQCATILQGGLALSGTLMIIMIGWVAYMLGSHLGRFLVFISPVGAAVMVRDYVRQSYFAQLRPVRALGVDIPVAILQVGAIGLLGHYGRLEGAEALYILGGVALLVCLVPFARSMRIRRVIRRHYLLRVLRKHVAFGRWMLASRAAYWVGIGGYPFLLTMTVGAADAGIFGCLPTVASALRSHLGRCYQFSSADIITSNPARRGSCGASTGLVALPRWLP